MPAPADSAPSDSGMPSSTSGALGPEGGPRTPTFLRRFVAVLLDWLFCLLIVGLLLRVDTTGGGVASLVPLAVFAMENILLVSLAGSTVGHRLLGMQVWQVRPGHFTFQVVVRTLLLCLLVPAVLTSRDGRGFHDVWAGTRIVRP